ncbi:hypothetical protein J6590_046120 [Homalodisca vitripennis]|nr:hypothetical protein J6590_046120 [Homalodisca vitripennis]
MCQGRDGISPILAANSDERDLWRYRNGITRQSHGRIYGAIWPLSYRRPLQQAIGHVYSASKTVNKFPCNWPRSGMGCFTPVSASTCCTCECVCVRARGKRGQYGFVKDTLAISLSSRFAPLLIVSPHSPETTPSPPPLTDELSDASTYVRNYHSANITLFQPICSHALAVRQRAYSTTSRTGAKHTYREALGQ